MKLDKDGRKENRWQEPCGRKCCKLYYDISTRVHVHSIDMTVMKHFVSAKTHEAYAVS